MNINYDLSGGHTLPPVSRKTRCPQCGAAGFVNNKCSLCLAVHDKLPAGLYLKKDGYRLSHVRIVKSSDGYSLRPDNNRLRDISIDDVSIH